ncbi:MAG: 23S rRNA (pseudouridine(1915)-N(3))-methyltransferase RlmH [Candidatus Wallbacteria bacterium]|nr:23S rRNA (pseudouridine(1915)-N(3))-methyltransferase RlmH [Candidatus Wallbacteria bacterium]
MIELRLVCVGKLRQPFCQDGVQEYAHRLRPHARLQVREVRSGREETVELARALEGCRAVMVLERSGRQLASEELANWLAESMSRGAVPIGFAIGGAGGLPGDFGGPQATRVSFSRLTFPHELFRVMLLEQLYRAFTILKGEPYHVGH